MDSYLQDLRYGFRMLLKSPGLTAAAVLTLALGIGANIAIFSFVDALYYRPLPVRDPDRVVALYSSCAAPNGGINRECGMASPDLDDIRTQAKSLESVGLFERRGAFLNQNGEVTHLIVNVTSDNFLEMMGVQPAVGRIFTAAEQAQATAPEALLSYTFWKRQYAGDPSVVGRTLTFTGRQWYVIGVLPKGYRGTEALLDPELTVPTSGWNKQFNDYGRKLADREFQYFEAYGRLRDGATVETLNTELATISARLRDAYPKTNAQREFSAVLEKDSRGDSRKKLAAMLLAIAGLLLLIACSNVANLLFARSEYRRREVATRLALGATRLRIAQQFFAESLLLAVAAGAAAVLIGMWTVNSLPALLADIPMPISIDAQLDSRSLIFAIAAAFIAVFAFGLAPAIAASRTPALGSLRSQSSTGDQGTRRPWVRDGVVVLQLCVSLMLIVSTGLLLRTILKMESMDPGFAAHRPMLVIQVNAPDRKGVTAVQQFRSMQQELAGLPGVASVAFASRMPMGPSGGGHKDEVIVPGKLQANGRGIDVKSAYVSQQYFETLGTRLMRGRSFNNGDDDETRSVVIVNQSMAKRFWGDEDAVGRHFRFGRGDGKQANRDFEVIGVVEDGKYNNLTEDPQPYLFLNMSQFRDSGVTLMIATRNEPSSLADVVRRHLRDTDGMTVSQLITLQEFMRFTMFANRLAAQLVAVMCGLGVLLAAVGLYGVISFVVGRRTHEVGVRMALGAQRSAILKLFLRRGLAIAGIGIALGVAGGLALSKTISALLYGVHPRDPVTFVSGAALLLVVAAAATYLPARRATQIEPMEALRYE